MAVKLRCWSCRKAFRWNTEEKWPDFCPLCNADVRNDRADDDVVMPFIRSSSVSKAHDKVYRDMEAASERRVADVAAITGERPADLSHLKITDLRPTVHPGSVAAPPLPAPLQNLGGYQTSGNEWAGAVKSGPFPNAGAKTLTSMQRLFNRG